MKPIQYSKGYAEFYKLNFKVNPDVLIPRPETELLVDWVLKHEPNKVLDLGTGSGNIIISIIKNLPKTRGIAIDISERALVIARQNAKSHNVEDKIDFIQSDLLSFFDDPSSIKSYPDVIVTNLPYIPSARIPYLDPSVKDYEPNVALDGGWDGFELYRKLFGQISSISPLMETLKYLVCEIDYTHGELAVFEAQNYFPPTEARVSTDLAHKQRLLVIKFTGQETDLT